MSLTDMYRNSSLMTVTTIEGLKQGSQDKLHIKRAIRQASP